MKFIIYHNPSCSKSCNALSQLKSLPADVEVIDYLQNPPGVEELTQIIGMLGMKPLDVIRQQEPEFAPYQGKTYTDEAYIRLMAENPILIQRPIVIKGTKAVILRPPLNLENL